MEAIGGGNVMDTNSSYPRIRTTRTRHSHGRRNR